MCWGRVLYSVIAVCINTYYTKRIIGLGLLAQMRDIFPYLAVSAVMGVAVFYCTTIFENSIISLLAGIVTGVIVYMILSYLFFRNDYQGVRAIMRKGNG